MGAPSSAKSGCSADTRAQGGAMPTSSTTRSSASRTALGRKRDATTRARFGVATRATQSARRCWKTSASSSPAATSSARPDAGRLKTRPRSSALDKSLASSLGVSTWSRRCVQWTSAYPRTPVQWGPKSLGPPASTTPPTLKTRNSTKTQPNNFKLKKCIDLSIFDRATLRLPE